MKSRIEGSIASMDIRFPFTLRVGQLMTGIGAGCGIGVGVGYPIAVGSIPVLGDVVRPLTSAGSQAFGGVVYRTMGLLKKLGIKNLKAGVGCGVGIGHGFGAGLALKPGVGQQLTQTAQKKLTGLTSHLQKQLPSTEAESQGVTMTVQPSSDPSNLIVANKSAEEAPGMRTGYVPSSELSPPSVTSEAVASTSPGHKIEDDLRHENQIFRTLLRHQELIEDLKEENASLRRMLSEQIDLQEVGNRLDLHSLLSPSTTFRGDPVCTRSKSDVNCSCTSCFVCRRKSRRRRHL